MRANVQEVLGLKPVRRKRMGLVVAALALGVAVTGTAFSAAGGAGKSDASGKGLWRSVSTNLAAVHDGQKATVRPTKLDAFKLDQSGIRKLLQLAPQASDKPESMQQKGLVVSLPDPKGGFQRFMVGKSNIMAPGLQLKHPEIATFSGKGIDDTTATIHADLSPLGFHASVRTPKGDWYIDPYSRLDQSVYATYYGHDVRAAGSGRGTPQFLERDSTSADISVDKGYYHAVDDVTASGSG